MCIQAKNRWENRSVSFFSRLLLWRFAKISKQGFCMEQNIHKSIPWLFIIITAHLLILGGFKVARCVLVDIITSSSVLQLRLLQTRNSALSLESKYQQLYQTKNCATIPKIKLKQCCRCHLPPSNISMQNSAKLTSVV